jgi:hypothetical protein
MKIIFPLQSGKFDCGRGPITRRGTIWPDLICGLNDLRASTIRHLCHDDFRPDAPLAAEANHPPGS